MIHFVFLAGGDLLENASWAQNAHIGDIGTMTAAIEREFPRRDGKQNGQILMFPGEPMKWIKWAVEDKCRRRPMHTGRVFWMEGYAQLWYLVTPLECSLHPFRHCTVSDLYPALRGVPVAILLSR